jgi:hypothetical protein
MTGPEAFDPDDAPAPAGEMIRRRASRRAEPDHDDIDCRHQQLVPARGSIRDIANPAVMARPIA